ncbi:MAG: activase, partial [Lachnospiraceae bacterium]|nr:activase [Lachnospiraceae bacterium]
MKFFGGCDSGSTYTKCVIIDENGKMVANVTLRSRINAVLSAQDALDQAIEQVPELNSAKD